MFCLVRSEVVEQVFRGFGMSEKLKMFVPTFVFATVLGMPVLAYAEPIGSSSFTGVINAITSQISVSTVAEVLTYAAGLAIALVFFWWGVRKALRVLMGAFRKGRMSV